MAEILISGIVSILNNPIGDYVRLLLGGDFVQAKICLAKIMTGTDMHEFTTIESTKTF
jgi:hypothetical protein